MGLAQFTPPREQLLADPVNVAGNVRLLHLPNRSQRRRRTDTTDLRTTKPLVLHCSTYWIAKLTKANTTYTERAYQEVVVV